MISTTCDSMLDTIHFIYHLNCIARRYQSPLLFLPFHCSQVNLTLSDLGAKSEWQLGPYMNRSMAQGFMGSLRAHSHPMPERMEINRGEKSLPDTPMRKTVN